MKNKKLDSDCGPNWQKFRRGGDRLSGSEMWSERKRSGKSREQLGKSEEANKCEKLSPEEKLYCGFVAANHVMQDGLGLSSLRNQCANRFPPLPLKNKQPTQAQVANWEGICQESTELLSQSRNLARTA